MSEQFVAPKDIPLIRSLDISQAYSDDKYSWSYMKSGLYTVKSRYWMARNIMYQFSKEVVYDPSITKLQAYA